ncbi:histidine kinase [Sphingomonas sp. LB-2]|uniref:sensor histidine kinase n=1 Tax=Sphingomonas caeni TaxID=2984949 RepID=UPI00222F7A09|nr:histidine kinase [Sphingomonas caeni]MCW3849510.1 histidine kinase [Sphingomonas caeni]
MSTAPPDPTILARGAPRRAQPAEAGAEEGRALLARLRPAILTFLVWTSVGVFLAAADALNGYFEWHRFVAKMMESWSWALLTPVLLLIDRKLASGEQNIVRLAFLFLVLSVPFSLAHTYLTGLLLYPITEIWWNPLRRHDYAVFYFLGSWQMYCGLVGVLYAFKYYNRLLTSQLQLERVEKSLLESRLNALRLQLEPHFLFNALNAISSEVASDPNLARDMIGDLGALLRQSLDCKDRAEITLAQELSLLEHYLSIQRVRFGDRIEIEIEIEPRTLSAMVPSMLLQPLVENAIRHGIEGRLSGGKVMISASRSGDRLLLLVRDDGVGLPADWRMEASTGLGVRVARERLAALYPDMGENGFLIRRRESGGTEVAISIPLHGAGDRA